LKKKRYIVTLITLLLAAAVVLSGCANNTPKDNQGSSDPTADFPKRPITIIVPWNPGGRGDLFGRAIAVPMEEYLGVPVVVSNEPGGVGVTGSYTVAKAKPDGYTLGSFATTHLFASYLKNPPFQPDKFVPIGGYAEIFEVIAVKADAPWKDFNDFVEDAAAHPGKYLHGNTGVGQDDHIYAEVLYAELGIDVPQMAYDGEGGQIPALMSGEVDIVMASMPAVIPYVASGELKVLAISSEERSEMLPDVPTFVEQGIDFTETAWTGLYAPVGIPDNVIAVLEKAMEHARNSKEFQKAINNMKASVNYLDSKGLKAKNDKTLPKIEQWLETLKALNIDLGI